MRIATYNLWNSPTSQAARLDAAREELSRIDSDVVALQEVSASIDDLNVAHYLGQQCGYQHVVMRPYPDDPAEGLALLSKHALSDVEAGWQMPFPALRGCGLRARLTIDRIKVAITNVHLAWDNIATRETQICQILEWIESHQEPNSYEILCGDFNCPPDSSVYRFLIGQQTLHGKGVTPWHDLARHHAERSGSVPPPTLDFWNNPRWKTAPTLEIPARIDWILLQDLFARGLPSPHLPDAGIFGTDPTPIAGVVPSDHYGVYADLDFKRED